MRFTGKNSVFTKDLSMDVSIGGTAKPELFDLVTLAMLKSVGTRIVIGEEALAAVSNGKGIKIVTQEGVDQNYLIVTLV